MNLFDHLSGAEEQAQSGRIYGVVTGTVTDNRDPQRLGRVKVLFSWLSDSDASAWARIAAPMAGGGRGICFLPEVHDEVLVAFDHGDPRVPYVLGALWNGQDKPPESNDDGNNDVRIIRSRSGHVIKLTDKAGGEKIEIIDMNGNSIAIDSAANEISIAAQGGKIKLAAAQIEIVADSIATLKGGTVNIN